MQRWQRGKRSVSRIGWRHLKAQLGSSGADSRSVLGCPSSVTKPLRLIGRPHTVHASFPFKPELPFEIPHPRGDNL